MPFLKNKKILRVAHLYKDKFGDQVIAVLEYVVTEGLIFYRAWCMSHDLEYVQIDQNISC